ncbi:hypothetical protein E2C01_032382 [Portunus trituberculatus]|uniref:Uncharacterized protein n=1 Tax=Portunus trituberculatus TaxID=210409 RepID=A0A5B7F0L4_PORTR|nr:hypothetical protein [Portunus trituberculatus]
MVLKGLTIAKKNCRKISGIACLVNIRWESKAGQVISDLRPSRCKQQSSLQLFIEKQATISSPSGDVTRTTVQVSINREQASFHSNLSPQILLRPALNTALSPLAPAGKLTLVARTLKGGIREEREAAGRQCLSSSSSRSPPTPLQ